MTLRAIENGSKGRLPPAIAPSSTKPLASKSRSRSRNKWHAALSKPEQQGPRLLQRHSAAAALAGASLLVGRACRFQLAYELLELLQSPEGALPPQCSPILPGPQGAFSSPSQAASKPARPRFFRDALRNLMPTCLLPSPPAPLPSSPGLRVLGDVDGHGNRPVGVPVSLPICFVLRDGGCLVDGAAPEHRGHSEGHRSECQSPLENRPPCPRLLLVPAYGPAGLAQPNPQAAPHGPLVAPGPPPACDAAPMPDPVHSVGADGRELRPAELWPTGPITAAAHTRWQMTQASFARGASPREPGGFRAPAPWHALLSPSCISLSAVWYAGDGASSRPWRSAAPRSGPISTLTHYA